MSQGAVPPPPPFWGLLERSVSGFIRAAQNLLFMCVDRRVDRRFPAKKEGRSFSGIGDDNPGSCPGGLRNAPECIGRGDGC